MAALDFPASPSLNQEYSTNNAVWKWNGSAWIRIGSISPGVQGAAGAAGAQGAQGAVGDTYWASSTAGLSTTSDVTITGVLTYEDVKNVDSVGVVTARAGIVAQGDVKLPDNVKLTLGTGSDTIFYQHASATDTWMYSQVSGNNLRLGTNEGDFAVYTGPAAGEMAIKANNNDAVELYFNGNKKFQTTNTGVTVTGTVAATSYTGDGSQLSGISAGVSTEFVHAQTHAVVGMTTLTGPVSFGNTATFKVNQKLYFNDGADNTFGSAYIYGDNYNLIVRNDNAAGSSYFYGNTCNLQGGSNKTGIRVSGSNGDVQFFHNNGIIGNTHSNGEGGIDIKESLRHSGDTDTKLKFGTDIISFETAGSERLRVDSDGVKFNGDTAAVNGLDDYEEGSFTPVLYGSSTGSSSNSVNGTGAYLKVGNKVTVVMKWVNVDGTTLPSGENIRIGSLPFGTKTSFGNQISSNILKKNVGHYDGSLYSFAHTGTVMYGWRSISGSTTGSWQSWTTSQWDNSGLYFYMNHTYITE